mgnify:FL=1
MVDGMEKNVNINLNTNFDIDFDKTISKEEYVERLIYLLNGILKQRFPDIIPKQQIKIHRDRISFACPICGDSMQSSFKKRGNIILEGKHKGYYKCFNCGEFKRVDQFFKNYKIDLELDVVNYISNNLGDFTTTSGGKYDISLLLDVKTIEGHAIDRQELKMKFGLTEVKESPVWSWLTKRFQYDEQRFLYNGAKNYLLILNLTPSGKIIGAQKRLFYGLNKYITFNLFKLYELLGKPKIEGKIADEINMISQLFGILQLNFNQPITIFEGPFDSFLFKNSVASTGANKAFPLALPVRYWFDDDKTGTEKSLKIIEEGYSVFLWDKFKKEMGLPYRKKWDLNDALIYLKKNNIMMPNFENFFSKDPLDIIDI